MKKTLLVATVQSHIAQFHRPLVQVLKDAGYVVHVAARNNLAEKNGLQLDFADKVYDVPFSRSPKSMDNIKAYRQLKEIIDNEHYDIIHCNTPMGGIVTRLAARKARKSGTKVYYTAHGFHFYQGAPKKNWIIFYPIEKFFSRFTDKLITITNEDYELARTKFHCDVFHIHGVGVNSDKYTVMDEDEKRKVKEVLGFDNGTKIILNVGELLPNKNQKAIISAMEFICEEYPECKLLIAGNGKEKENLEKTICEKQLEEQVILLGYTTELQKYVNIANVLVACSYREGLPLNIMEAMLCKKPIVASWNRGHRELVVPEKTGFLVQPDDVAAYAAHVIELLGNEELCTNMGEEAYEFAARFTDFSVKNELCDIYELKG